MNTATEAKDAQVIQIQVFWQFDSKFHVLPRKQKTFFGWNWKEAIIFFLGKSWGDGQASIEFYSQNPDSKRTLASQPHVSSCYYFGSCGRERLPNIELFRVSEEMLVVGYSPAEVENGLIRFVKNDRIKRLLINFDHNRFLQLRKGEARTELFMTDTHFFGNPPEIGYGLGNRG